MKNNYINNDHKLRGLFFGFTKNIINQVKYIKGLKKIATNKFLLTITTCIPCINNNLLITSHQI